MENKSHPSKAGRKTSTQARGKANLPLEFIDGGCQMHAPSTVKISTSQGCQIIAEIIGNLQKDGESPTYICKHGHTHHLRVKA